MAYKLLLADDSITIQKVVELTLSEEDFDVAAFGDGESALEAARRLVPDIVLADVFMPKMDGYELCGRLKADPALGHVPVILLAGTFENFDEARAARAGADDHVTKPFESADLVSKVKRLVELKKSAPEFLEVEPIEEAIMAEEAAYAPSQEVDDLWSVVDMGSADQPLADATETLTEDELWRRASLVSDLDKPAQGLDDEEGMPWDAVAEGPVLETEGIPAEVVEAEEAFEAEPYEEAIYEEAVVVEEEDAAVPTPEYDLEGLSTDVVEPMEEEPAAVSVEPLPFENAQPVEEVPVYAPPEAPPAAQSAQSAQDIPLDIIREEVKRAVREALSELSRETIEQVVWEVLPDIAEELVRKEIEDLRAGAR